MWNWNTSTLCLFCEKSLSVPLRLIGRRFCSHSHEREYVKRMNDLAVNGLHAIARRFEAMQNPTPVNPITPPPEEQPPTPSNMRGISYSIE
jgi:hypothetical protein